MSKSLQTLLKFGGLLTVLFSATAYNPAKASAQSLLPDIHLLEGGQVCLALCTSPRSTVPAQGSSLIPNQGLGALSSQVLQLPGQILQLPQQVLSFQSSSVIRPNLSVPPNNLPSNNAPVISPGAIPPGSPQVMQQSMQSVPAQGTRPNFLQKIAPILPVVIQQLSK